MTPNINTRLAALEKRLQPATHDENETWLELTAWCETHELVSMAKLFKATPGDEWPQDDRLILEILQRAHERREQYGSVEAWQKAQKHA